MNKIAQVRRFNRTVTHQIGALESDYLGRNRPMGASRVLFEIGLAGLEVRVLRVRLGLDSGYTSRLLRSLEEEGLIQSQAAKRDKRVRLLTLTKKGRAEWRVIDQLSDQLAASMLEPLTEKQQATLTEAMNTVERLLRAGAVELRLEDASSQVAQACIANYYLELQQRFEGGFDPGHTGYASVQELVPPNGCFVVAWLHDSAVGCGALAFHTGYAEIKRMWIAESMRGLGLSRRILGRLEGLASEHGHTVVRLDTNKALKEAQTLYKSSGYREIQRYSDNPYAHHWFEKKL